MHKRVYILFTLLFFADISFAQDGCFNSKEQAKNYALGVWKLKDVPSNIIYKFTWKNDKVDVEIIEDLDYIKDANNDLVFESNQEIKVSKLNDCYILNIEISSKAGTVINDLSFNSKDQFEYLEQKFIRLKY